MANRIQIRHGSNAPTTNNLLPFELGWDGDTLYINNGKSTQEIIAIGGIIPISNTTGTLPINRGGTGATTATAARTSLGLGSIAVKATTDYLPVSYAQLDFSSATTTQGVYPLKGGTHPITNVQEYGGVLQFGSMDTSHNYYAAQLIVSSASGSNSPPHAYIRCMTNAPAWGVWSTLLDNNNYTTYTVTKAGTGASGTWAISISGTAATTNKIITASDSTQRSIYVTTTNAAPSGARENDIVLVKVS